MTVQLVISLPMCMNHIQQTSPFLDHFNNSGDGGSIKKKGGGFDLISLLVSIIGKLNHEFRKGSIRPLSKLWQQLHGVICPFFWAL